MLLCMHLYDSSSDYLFNLQATSSSDAKRMWRQSIKDKWKHKCDADNIIKPLVDLLVRAEIVPDDKTRYINSVKVRYLQGFGPPVTCISYTISED